MLGRNVHLKDEYLPRDVKFGDKMSHSLIFMFLYEKLISKLVIHHVSFLEVNTSNVLKP